MMSWAFLLLQLPMKSREHIGNWLSNSTQMSTKRLVSLVLHNPFLYFSKIELVLDENGDKLTVPFWVIGEFGDG